MNVPYSFPTGLSGATRPLVDVSVAGSVPTACLVDSGALGIRMPLALAYVNDVDLSDATAEVIRIGGGDHSALTVQDVPLQVGRWYWRAPVTFIGRWEDHPILGTLGFFDHYDVDFRFGGLNEFRLAPNQGPGVQTSPPRP